MNLLDRNVELDKALALKEQIAQVETRLDATDGEEGRLKDELQKAHKECKALIKVGRKPQSRPSLTEPRQVKPSRMMVLFDEIHELQEKLRHIVHEPSILQNTLRRLGSDFGGFASRDWQWLKNWRIGREQGMKGPLDVEDESQCKMWLHEVQAHASVFLSGPSAEAYIAESEAKLKRRRAELAAGRQRNAETDAAALRMQAEIVAERERRAEENRERLKESDKQRADFRAQLDREMAEAKVEASLAFDRRVAKKEVKRHAWLAKYWTKIAKARDDKAFRDEWLTKVFAKNPKRGHQLQKVFRSAGDSASALRGAEQFDLIRQRWVRVVELLDADPTLTMDEAEEVADPEYQEQRAEIKELDEARLAAHNAAQAT